MKTYLETLQEPTLENLNKIRHEIERSETIVKYHQNIISLLENEVGEYTKKSMSKQLDVIEYENDFIEEATKLKIKIATKLSSLGIKYYE